MSIRTSVAWTFSEQFLQYGIQLAASVIIARLLTPDEMGVFALAMSASAILTSLRTFGIGNYLIREPELTLDKIRSAFGVMLVISWSLGLALFLLRDLIAGIYERPDIADVISLISLNFFVAPFGAPAFSMLTREMRFQALHNIGLATSATGSFVSVALAYSGASYMALAWGLLTTSFLHAICCMAIMPRYALLWPSFVHWRKITHFGGLLAVSSLFGTVNSEGITFFLGVFINPAAVAQFNRAVQVPSLLRQGIFGPISRVLTPAWSKDVRDGRSIGPAAEKLTALNTAIVWPPFLALSLISVPFIVLVFGPNWQPAGEIFPWVLLSNAVLAMLPQPEQVLVPHGQVGRVFTVRSVGVLISLALTAYAAPLGLNAFAISRVVISVIFLTLIFFAVKSVIEFKLGTYVKLYLRSAVIAVVASIPAAVFHFTGRESMTLPELLLIVASCAVLWLLGIALTRHFIWQEVLSLGRHLLDRLKQSRTKR
ncbi:MAG: oligosaccharide flippase family protein [Kiloniellaceae bacterium]